MRARPPQQFAAAFAVNLFFLLQSIYRLLAYLDDVNGREGAVRDGAADTTRRGTLEVVHQIVSLLASSAAKREGATSRTRGEREKNLLKRED